MLTCIKCICPNFSAQESRTVQFNCTTTSSGLLKILCGMILLPNPLLTTIDVFCSSYKPAVYLGKTP